MGEWADLIWFIVWAVVILAGVGLALWAVLAVFAMRRFKKTEEIVRSRFDSFPDF